LSAPVRDHNLSTPAALILALVLPIFAVAPLFYPGPIQIHSGFVPLWNITNLQANGGDVGWLPVIAIHFDPLRSDGLLFYYLAVLLPFSPLVSTKLVVIAGWLLGSAGMFLWLRRWVGNPGAVIAALVYVYLPFQLATVYVRGAWGEALFWGLLPWAILAATFLVTSPRLVGSVLAGAGWLLLGLSQLGLTLWAFIFLTLLLLVVHFRQSLWPIVSAWVGMGAAFALYLFVAEFSVDSAITFADHFLYPFQLFSAAWGFGVSRPGWNDGLSLQVGLAGVGLTMVTVILWQRSATVGHADRRLLYFLGAAMVLVLFALGAAAFIWRIPVWPEVTLADTLSYPWQLLGFVGLCTAVLAGAALWLDNRLAQLPLFGAIILFVVLSSYSYLRPQFLQPGSYVDAPPQAQLGDYHIVLLAHDCSVLTGGYTAGLERGQTSVPLSVHGPLHPGDVLQANVVWQPLRPLPENLKVFVHLVGPAGNVLAQYDGYPQSGNYPTGQWIPGELVADSYPVIVPPNAPPGPYQIYLGFYNEATLTRLPVPNDTEGRVILHVE
jgi:hypothetical protein